MKSQRIKARGRSLKEIQEEYLMLGYEAVIEDDEVVVFYGTRPRKQKRQRGQQDKWSKRERNFGYTRG